MLFYEYQLLNLQSLWGILTHMLEQTEICRRVWSENMESLHWMRTEDIYCSSVVATDSASWIPFSSTERFTSKDGSTVRSEFAYYVPRTLNRTSVPYFSSIFEAYRTDVPYQYHYKKGVPYQRTAFLSKNWGVPYCTYPYRTAILAFNYSQL